MELICPFCGHDPYHYVDIGVGRQPVAVECCELGVAYFTGESETVEIDRSDFDEIAKRLRAIPSAPTDDSGEVERLREALAEAMEWNWMDEDTMPAYVVKKCEQALAGAKP